MDEIDHLMGKGPATLDDVNNVLLDIWSDLRDLKDHNERKTEDLTEVLTSLDNNIRIIRDVLIFIAVLVAILLIRDALGAEGLDTGRLGTSLVG